MLPTIDEVENLEDGNPQNIEERQNNSLRTIENPN